MAALEALPTGILTLVFYDVEASSAIVRARRSDRYGEGLGDVRRLLRRTLMQAGGREVDAHGGEVFTLFARAPDAIAGCLEAQRAVQRAVWPDGANVRVRMGVHTGEPVLVAYGYTGEAVHQAARLCAAARGGEVLVSQATHDALASAPAPEVELRDLGRAAIAGGAGAERVFQVVAPGLPDVAPPRLEALRGV